MACNNERNYDGTESVNLNKITSLIRKYKFFFALAKLAKSETYFAGFVRLLRHFVFKVLACYKF
jgi:hypothetical protein